MALCCAEREPAALAGLVPVRPLPRQPHRHLRDGARRDRRMGRRGVPRMTMSGGCGASSRSRGPQSPPIHLGLGREDRFGERHRLLAARCSIRATSIPCRAGMTGPRGADSGTIFSMPASPPAAETSRHESLARQRVPARLARAASRGRRRRVIARPALWPWALGAVVADHLLISAAGLWPRSRLLGPNWTRLPARGRARDRHHHR